MTMLALADVVRARMKEGELEMPGTVIELELSDALAVIAAHAHEPEVLLWKCTADELDTLLLEARRVVQWHAFGVAERCFPRPQQDEKPPTPRLRLV